MTTSRRERMKLVWKPAHLAGVLVIAMAFIDAASIAYFVRILLFLYFILASLDLALTRYHLWNFEPTIPTPKRYALVTGASSGIGREMSYLLSEQKYSLVLAARSKAVLERMRVEIEMVNQPSEVLVCVCDLGTDEGISKLINFVHEKKLIIDILVNNAGASLVKNFTEHKETEVDWTMTLNTKAMVKLTHALVPQMVERKVGRVLNISSIAAIGGVPMAALYCSSKAFMLNFSQALSYELRSTGVTVTCVCPGPVYTNFLKAISNDYPVCMKLPGVAADPKDTAKVALDAMFNGEILVNDTWYSYLCGNLIQAIIPRRLAAFCLVAGFQDLKGFWQVLKR
ncbi:hypothetical protein PsorP6_008868 [Peronosclerospora sorghi]|uniref:Uncharacterized protein n=1 Tax=Peronosclerospora sorghi TaxID=230839 RepID=A0ACC0VYD5_9STRA|nr:hypothetical protein PsorP6_008868 [Peronosclerospora sorghi]